MNAATENNNELGISLLLGGVRGALLEARLGGLCLCGWVYLAVKCVFVLSIYRGSIERGSFIGKRRLSCLYKRGGMVCLVL
jgi:hypothetical protein